MRPLLSATVTALAGLAATCAPYETAPRIDAVSPSWVVSGDAVDLVIRGRSFLPRVVASYGSAARSVVDDRFEAELGGAALSDVEFVSTTELHARLVTALPDGPQPLTIRTPTGATATLADAVVVGARPASAFVWDAIDPVQTAGVAFSVRAVALDDAGAPFAFSGSAALATSDGTALSCLSGCDAVGSAVFQGGELRAQVALEATSGIQLSVTSGAATGASNAFDVRYPPPVSIAFGSGAQIVAAGACSAEVRVELRDAAGQPVPANAQTELALSVVPAGTLAFFSDAACTVPVSTLQIAAGDSAATLHFSRRLAGAAVIAVRLAELMAWQLETIVPGPTAAFLWDAIGPQTAGAVFSVRAGAVDAYGNETLWTGAATLSASVAGLRCLSGCDASGQAQLIGGAFDGLVSIDTAAAAATLTLATAEASSTSSPFEVIALVTNPPVALAFATAPRAVTAGMCSPPVLVQLRDASGQVVPAPDPVAVTLSQAPPAAIALYEDAACTSPLVAPVIPKGESELTFYFSGRTAGVVTVTASAAGLLPDDQPVRIEPAPATRFDWDPLPASVRRGVDFAVAVRASDQFGNTATSFSSTAALTISPSAELLCSIGCSGPLVTSAFSAGRWSGWVRVGAPAGAGRALAATSGPATGSSAEFTVEDQTRTPPRALIARSASWVRVGGEVTFDGSGSSDPESGSDALEMSWDTAGGAAPPGVSPWTGWSRDKQLTTTFAAPGLQRVRLAVRDTDGDLGYAIADVLVIDATTPVCILSDPGNADDGITTCNDPDLSLTEAIRISNSTTALRELIVVPDGFVATLASKLTVTSGVDIAGGPGSELRRVEWAFQGGRSVFLGVSLVGEKVFNIASAASLQVSDVRLSGFDRVYTKGGVTIESSRFEDCRGDPCLSIDTPAADVRVMRTTFESPSRDAVYVFDCVNGAREFVGDTFRNLDRAVHVKAGCGAGPVKIAHDTFDAINQAFVIESGVGHVFANNAITGVAMAVVSKCDASFSLRGYNVEWDDAVADCTRSDPGTLYADPQYLDASSADYRLRSTSPARDSALDLGFDLAPAMPTRFLGLAPDRGGVETW